METETRDLLIEIGTEELPPKALKHLSEAFLSNICAGLDQQEIYYFQGKTYATPRRLGVLIEKVVIVQASRQTERRGPSLKAAFDEEGNPTRAADGFARSCGVSVNELDTLENEKGAWLVYRNLVAGEETSRLVPDIINNALANLPIPKRMRWSDFSFEFVRPVHWVVILFDEEVIDAEIMGVRSGRDTRGHRFHHPDSIRIHSATQYANLLEEKGFVIPTFAVRRETIQHLIEQTADDLDAKAMMNNDLLDEVTSLVEWPVVVTGQFDEKFLDIPDEALIAVMQKHQKYFPVTDKKGNLLPYFITISNIDSTQPDLVKAGNERVIRPRLSDAAFFWEKDKGQSLESRLDSLKTVVFQHQLGNLYDKSKRIAQLSGKIAGLLGKDELQGIRAAQLSKCDLITDMVGEFAELQGIMGEYYALQDGETKDVAIALREQYMPRFSGDNLPENALGQALSIADKLDTLVGIFGIGQPPTGDKDPFGLRRAALGVLRIMIECQLPLDLLELLKDAESNYHGDNIKENVSTQVFDFMLERLSGYYQDKGVNIDSIDAVLSCRPSQPFDIDKRIQGVELFRRSSDAVNLASANKRIHNILKKTTEIFPDQPDPTYFSDMAERLLFDEVEIVQEKIAPLLKEGHYQAALKQLATLQETVDNFFDRVMVMDKKQTVRLNRLAFLHKVRSLFLQIADISRLQI